MAPAVVGQLYFSWYSSTWQPPLGLFFAATSGALPSCPISLVRMPAPSLESSDTSSCWDATSSSGVAAQNRVSAWSWSLGLCWGLLGEDINKQGSPPYWDRLLVLRGGQWVVWFCLLSPYLECAWNSLFQNELRSTVAKHPVMPP